LAGIYDTWINSSTGNLIYSYSILTTHANQMMEKIHNVKKRMPVVLNEENAEKWLLLDAPSRQELCKPCPEEFLSSHTVSMKLNSPKNIRNEPWAIEPAIFAKQTTLF
jgi:putative SOS response-associated peptidase YedK